MMKKIIILLMLLFSSILLSQNIHKSSPFLMKHCHNNKQCIHFQISGLPKKISYYISKKLLSNISLLCSSDAQEIIKNKINQIISKLGYNNFSVKLLLSKTNNNDCLLAIKVNEEKNYTIKQVKIFGIPNININTVLEQLALTPGKDLQKNRLQEKLQIINQALFNKSYFSAKSNIESIRYDKKLQQASIDIKIIKGNKFKISIAGAKTICSLQLKDAASYVLHKQGLDKYGINLIIRRLTELYAKIGFVNVKINYTLLNNKTIVFNITEGNQTIINKIKFLGASSVNKQELNNLLKKRKKQYLSSLNVNLCINQCTTKLLLEGRNYFAKKTKRAKILNNALCSQFQPQLIFNTDFFNNFKDNIKNYLKTNGYNKSLVLGPYFAKSKTNNIVDIYYKINENIKEIISELNFNIVDTKNKTKELNLKTTINKQEALNLKKVNENKILLVKQLNNLGYPYSKVDSKIIFDDNKAKVNFIITLGKRIVIGSVKVIGNATTKAKFIKNVFSIEPGEFYNYKKITVGKKNLLDLDIFENIKIRLLQNKLSLNKEALLVSVKERPRTTVDAGGGISFKEGPRLFINLVHRNILGLGMISRNRLQLNYPALFYSFPYLYNTQTYENLTKRYQDVKNWWQPLLYLEGQLRIGMDLPFISSIPLPTKGHLDFNISRNIKPFYTLNKIALNLGTTTNYGHKIRFGPQIEFEGSDFKCVNTGLYNCGEQSSGIVTRQETGIINQLTIRLFIISSTHPSKMDLFSKGKLLSLSLDLSLGKANRFIENIESYNGVGYTKLLAHYKHLFTLSWFKIYISTNLGGIINFSKDNYMPLYKRFYLGGASTIRGFAEEQIIPADSLIKTKSNQDLASLGGNYFFSQRMELRLPIVDKFETGLFVDFGELLKNIENFSLKKLSAGSGLGFRYNTPIGTFSLDFALVAYDYNRKITKTNGQFFRFHISFDT